MEIKINEKILSIPPHISTTWTQVSALCMKGNLLCVNLLNGDTVNIANLDQEQIRLIFSCHVAFLEKEIVPLSDLKQHSPLHKNHDRENPLDQAATLSFAFGSMDGFNAGLQHNPEQANSPNLPPEILDKISHFVQKLTSIDDFQIPKAEPHCNCFYCQIARKINQVHQEVDFDAHLEELFEFAPEEKELKKDALITDHSYLDKWQIVQEGEQLYGVSNRLDKHEKYSVFLGCPVGCTCGKADCEHILAVLKS